MKNFSLLLTLQLLANLVSQAQTGIRFEPETTTFAQIAEQAKRDQRPVFVAAYSKSCHTCEQMISNIYPNDSLAASFSNFLNLKLDVDAEQNAAFVAAHQINGYPMYLFFDENGSPLHRAAGGKSVEKMQEMVAAARDPEQQFYLLQNRYAAGHRDATLLKNLVFEAKELQDFSILEKAVPEYLATQTDWTTRENLSLIVGAVQSIEQPIFKFLLEKKDIAIAALADESKVKDKIDEVALNSLGMSSYDHQSHKFDLEKAKNYAAQHALPSELVEKTISIFQINQLMRAGEQEQFFQAVKTHFEKFECHNALMINNFALQVLEFSTDPQQLLAAANWVQHALIIRDNYTLNDLAAAIFLKAGDRATAKTYALHAIEVAKKSNENSAATQRLLVEIETK